MTTKPNTQINFTTLAPLKRVESRAQRRERIAARRAQTPHDIINALAEPPPVPEAIHVHPPFEFESEDLPDLPPGISITDTGRYSVRDSDGRHLGHYATLDLAVERLSS